MFIADEKKILTLMRNLFNKRLTEVVNEVDVFDSRGNMLLGKDLKVRHKGSGYEYTVADVQTDPSGKNSQIVLRLPSEPRIEPEGEEELLADTGNVKTLGEDDLIAPASEPGDLALPQKQTVPAPATGLPDKDEELFVIDQEEFEKEYEVK